MARNKLNYSNNFLSLSLCKISNWIGSDRWRGREAFLNYENLKLHWKVWDITFQLLHLSASRRFSLSLSL